MFFIRCDPLTSLTPSVTESSAVSRKSCQPIRHKAGWATDVKRYRRMELVNETKEALVARVGALEQRFADLRNSMRASAALPTNWRLTPKERDLFLSLLANDTVTKEMAMLVLYGTEDRPDHSVAMFMSRIRSKTEPHSVKIETINRTGYRLVWTKTLKLDAVEH
ncbi:helix-turn-helix domain-containing protein [Bradyrhizobium barranii subsp. barranii]|uniref:Helix-turn-helix domain-containing protein n=2 Tax=Bradyrhizobium barranii subsp. barranii TaxID=2823807 RepID=A0A9X9XNP4_9BRAD|nr:helix-turn-helix domain-containing protein [Bradyrhizobium barranii]UEM09288.1 helix-turn-helix domain-containing protein [Bradyrhizobium barranii subsp. barranii]